MHFQAPPRAQDKLVRVVRGAIFDVAVDVRRGSPSFGRWVGVTLSSEEWNQLFVPKGFAHGFVTLQEETEVVYKASDVYSPSAERSFRFDDPQVGIEWPVDVDAIEASPKDLAAPELNQVETGFEWHK